MKANRVQVRYQEADRRAYAAACCRQAWYRAMNAAHRTVNDPESARIYMDRAHQMARHFQAMTGQSVYAEPEEGDAQYRWAA